MSRKSQSQLHDLYFLTQDSKLIFLFCIYENNCIYTTTLSAPMPKSYGSSFGKSSRLKFGISTFESLSDLEVDFFSISCIFLAVS